MFLFLPASASMSGFWNLTVTSGTSPFQGKSFNSAAIFAALPGSSNKTKSNLNELGNPEIPKHLAELAIKLHISRGGQ